MSCSLQTPLRPPSPPTSRTFALGLCVFLADLLLGPLLCSSVIASGFFAVTAFSCSVLALLSFSVVLPFPCAGSPCARRAWTASLVGQCRPCRLGASWALLSATGVAHFVVEFATLCGSLLAVC